MISGSEIMQRVKKDLETDKIPERYYRPLSILMSYPSLWESLHKGMYLYSKTLRIEFDYNIKVVSFVVVGNLFDFIKDNIAAYAEYIFKIYTGKKKNIIIKYNTSYYDTTNDFADKSEALKDKFIEYTLYYNFRLVRKDDDMQRINIIKTLYKEIYNTDIDDDSLEISLMLNITDSRIDSDNLPDIIKQDKKITEYINELINKGFIDNDLYPLKKWREIKKEIARMSKYGVCAICGNMFKRLRSNQFFCGKNDNGAKCKMRYNYLFHQAKGLTFKSRDDLKQQLIDIYNRKAKGNKPAIWDWDIIIDNIIKRLSKK